MFIEAVVFLCQPIDLQPGSDKFERMGNGSGEDPTHHPCSCFVHSLIFHFLVNHVIEPCKKPFFHAGG